MDNIRNSEKNIVFLQRNNRFSAVATNPIKGNVPWKKGQSGNPKGRPKKNYRACVDALKKQGYAIPSREEYFEMIGLLLVMDEAALKDFAADKSNPLWIRLIIQDLGDKKIRAKLQMDYRDWLFGKANQKIEATHEVSTPQPIIVNFKVDDER